MPVDTDGGKSHAADVTAASLIDPLKLRNDKMMAVLAERERQMKGLQAEYKEYKATSSADLNKEKLAKQSLKEELAALHGQLETLKARLIEGQRNAESVKLELEEKNKSLEKQVESLSIDKAFAQEKTFHLQGEKEDAEARLKLAHFHMAKKVKETAELEESIVSYQSKIEELTYDLALSQKMFDDYKQAHENRVRDEELNVHALKVALEQAQQEAKQWEEKYFIGLDKWRGQERRIAELVVMEEKMLKMKSLINSFNTPQERCQLKLDKGDQQGGQA
jgi:hypothetical protein